ncbi:hypothetical protein QIG42_27135, partial [Klebsiella pneumoniae]|nr:hypothetical protein [Klebsiella pneumoniae]
AAFHSSANTSVSFLTLLAFLLPFKLALFFTIVILLLERLRHRQNMGHLLPGKSFKRLCNAL